MNPPILAYADYSLPFTVHTDASRDGLGAILYQEQEGKDRVIAYASRSVSRAEQNYPTHKLEFLALRWAVTDKFHEYLYGNDFTVYTDNNPLTYILTTAKLDAAGHRWLAALAAYNFTIKYKPGRKNIDADILSRLPRRYSEETGNEKSAAADGYCELSPEAINAICNNITIPTAYVETLCLSALGLEEEEADPSAKNVSQWRTAQREDPVIGPVLRQMSQGQRPDPARMSRDQETQLLLREYSRLKLVRGVMYREVKIDGDDKLQLVLPKAFREMALKGLHDDIGHMGRDRTLDLVRRRFFWPKMSRDVEDKVKNCVRCVMRKTPTNARAPLVNIRTTQPLEIVSLDFLSLEQSKGGFESILVITDHYTRYAQAIPTRNQTARTTAEALFNNFIVHYGFP